MPTIDSMCLIGRVQGSMGTGVKVSAMRLETSVWIAVLRRESPLPTTDFM